MTQDEDFQPGGSGLTDESMLAKLLEEDVLFANSFQIKYPTIKELGKETIVLFVNCNDLFYWGTADCEHLTLGEVRDLFEAWRADPSWGVSIWCCKKRKLRPQVPIVKMMKEQGVWTDELEALPAPHPS
jgi:hypothetical protein